jgi:hypothetical protein
MNRRLFFAISLAPFAIAVLAVTGCSNDSGLPADTPGTSAAGTSAASPLPSSPPAGQPTAAGTSAASRLPSSAPAGQPTATQSPAAAAPPQLLYPAPGRWIEPGEQMKVAGIGCKPDSKYTVTESSQYGSGQVLAMGQATASGRFLAAVTVHSLGEPNSVLGVTCDNSAGTTIRPYQMELTFIPSVGARPTVNQGTKIPLTGGSGCRPGSIVQAVTGARAEGYRVIGQSTASASGAFSVEASIPALSAGVNDVFAACPWSGANEPFYPAYMQVIFASSGRG